ncbi:hypothetical protein CMI47_11365 [Candidatus Pacearchaeota archaeon]|nr:hypothetical protein [Candidatus Pacearchaeota archaeon]|tara:strand:- start:219 stop:905 length:687 start_codon:yes stop_codon:yes gene_type:complete
MTTVFGYIPNYVEAGVLVADKQFTQSDQAGTPIGKQLQRKLWQNQDGTFAFGISGTMHSENDELVRKIISGDINIQRVTEKGNFPELRKINIAKMGREVPNTDDISGLIGITRFDDKPRLFNFFPLGSVQERVYTTIGSGSPRVEEYLTALGTMNQAQDYMTSRTGILTDAIQIGLEAVRRSQAQDLYSHGLDMMVVTPERINDHSEDLDDNFGRTLRSINRKYKPAK